MERFREFLESSSIHGLIYISTAKSFSSKFFWIMIVALSFVTSTILIESLFRSWSVNPVSTTVETKPISKSHFPRVTVCPPSDSLTSTNTDLKKAENMTLEKGLRTKLANLSAELIEDEVFKVIEEEEKAFIEDNKSLNWYTGFSMPTLSREVLYYSGNTHTYDLRTAAIKGYISTPWFGEPFQEEKFKKKCQYEYTVFLPENITNITTSLVLNIRLDTVGELQTTQYEKLFINSPGLYSVIICNRVKSFW